MFEVLVSDDNHHFVPCDCSGCEAVRKHKGQIEEFRQAAAQAGCCLDQHEQPDQRIAQRHGAAKADLGSK